MPTFDVARIKVGDRTFHVVRFDGRALKDANGCNALIERSVRVLRTPVLLLDKDERYYGEPALAKAMRDFEPSSLPWEPRRMD